MEIKKSAIDDAIEFIESLPEEFSFVIVEDSEEQTKTLGKEFVLSGLKGDQ